MVDEVILARAFLSRVAEPANIPLWHAVRTLGPVDVVQRIRAGEIDDDIRHAVSARCGWIDPHADLDAADRHSVRLVYPESDEWPHFAMAALERTGAARFAEYANGNKTHAYYGEPVPPLALWVRGSGDLASVGVRSVGVVGARSATAYGEQVAADLAYGTARREFVVVSGGAYGIDAAAHRGALSAGGSTVIVSAGGLDRAYPPSNARLYDRAAETGLLVSESPPGAAPQRRRFLTRNRLIAALSTGTVVVEASLRSGALNTAGHCRRLGRPLMAVPGPITSPVSAGCHQILSAEQEPAVLVTGVDDVLLVVGGSGDLPPPPPTGDLGDDIRRRLDGIDERARLVYDAFPARRAVRPDQLSAASGLSPLDVIRALPALELSALVEAVPDGYRRRRTATTQRDRSVTLCHR